MKYNTIEESIFSSITLLFSVEEIRSFFCSLTKAHNSKLLQELTKCANLEQTILQCAQALRQNKHYFWLPHLHASIISKLEGKDKEQYVHLFKIAICEEEKKIYMPPILSCLYILISQSQLLLMHGNTHILMVYHLSQN